MEIAESSIDGVVVLVLTGRMDSASAGQMNKWIETSLPAAPARLVVGMSGVSFIDSTGLSILVQVMKRCRERKGNLAIFGLQPNVRMIFELTRLDKAFDIFGGEKEALRSFA